MTGLESFASVLTGLKQTSLPVIVGIGIGCAIILFGSDDTIIHIGLSEFRDTYRSSIGGALVFSIAITTAHIVFRIAKYLQQFAGSLASKQKGKETLANWQASLHSITSDEKAYLADYILRGETTQYFPMEDGVVGSLRSKKIIYIASNLGSFVDGWAFNIQPWARDYLELHPELLEGANPNPDFKSNSLFTDRLR